MARIRKIEATAAANGQKPIVWRIAAYIRLSRDDGGGESLSVTNQRKIILEFIAERFGSEDSVLVDFYIDDGYSSTNVNRPGVQEMDSNIESSLVSMVVVKDMSRSRCNYLEEGLYTEIRIPKMGVRFAAANDGVDRKDQMDNDFTPFSNIKRVVRKGCREKDTRCVLQQVLIRPAAFHQRPCGYIKGEDGKPIVDKETAPVVELIFRLCAVKLTA